MQEQDRLAMGARLGLAVAQHPRARWPSAGRARPGYRRPRSRYGGCRRRGCGRGRRRWANSAPSGSSSSILVLGKVTKTTRDAVLGLRQRGRDLGAQRLGIEPRSRRQIRHRDRHVIQSSDHDLRFLSAVIPAKAGIQGLTRSTLPLALDPRFRGDDEGGEPTVSPKAGPDARRSRASCRSGR